MNNRGYFGIGIFQPKYECNTGTLWRSAYAFGASFIFTIGQRFRKQASDTPSAWRHVPMYNYTTIEKLVQTLPYNCPLIGIELDDKARPLDNFCHPERACYLLGAEDHGIPQKILSACHHIVQLNGLKMCLNVATAGSLVMYDRCTKASTRVSPCK